MSASTSAARAASTISNGISEFVFMGRAMAAIVGAVK
jgi:hypothetical protein